MQSHLEMFSPTGVRWFPETLCCCVVRQSGRQLNQLPDSVTDRGCPSSAVPLSPTVSIIQTALSYRRAISSASQSWLISSSVLTLSTSHWNSEPSSWPFPSAPGAPHASISQKISHNQIGIRNSHFTRYFSICNVKMFSCARIMFKNVMLADLNAV